MKPDLFLAVFFFSNHDSFEATNGRFGRRRFFHRRDKRLHSQSRTSASALAGRPLLFNLPVAYYTTFFRPQLMGLLHSGFSSVVFRSAGAAKYLFLLDVRLAAPPNRRAQSKHCCPSGHFGCSCRCSGGFLSGDAAGNDRVLGDLRWLRHQMFTQASRWRTALPSWPSFLRS